MRVALFVPCYIDQLKPEVGMAALEVLEAFGFDVVFPEAQTCCGQAFLTAGESRSATSLFLHYLDVFEDFDQVVTLSGSCAATVRKQLPQHVPGSRAESVASRTFEFCEFLVAHDVTSGNLGRFPHRVGLHASCHALRELGLGMPSELRGPDRLDPARALLSCIEGIQLVDLSRVDECCGFGGVFAVEEEAVSCRMGLDRLADHRLAGSEIITSTDISCLFQLQGLAAKSGSAGFEFRMLHIAELLAESLAEIEPERRTAGDGNGGFHGTS
jgi:L-lactate dehydrogenase complex protein LldE